MVEPTKKPCQWCAPEGVKPCGANNPDSTYPCTRAGGHYSDHISCLDNCGLHVFKRWKRDDSDAERYHELLMEILDSLGDDDSNAEKIRKVTGVE